VVLASAEGDFFVLPNTLSSALENPPCGRLEPALAVPTVGDSRPDVVAVEKKVEAAEND
jgi:hypothetical protein